ncbi:hypothetical protein O6H91_05G113100 [Diphasiastrum complanatum]|uniref:Uncharacterized protein n=1 Tax=Diphasiastrum complanatum TaxID=34168 RepID=A0ACC2DSB1_DIPCM|nr:hypothetical protein O6H91_05G113100 [Diphasiastrum complanatum]
MENALLVLPTASANANTCHVARLHGPDGCQQFKHGFSQTSNLLLDVRARMGAGEARQCANLQTRKKLSVSATAAGSLPSSDEGKGVPADMAILLEIDGVLADIHRHGHRQSFNVAFQDMGLDCANWTQPVYTDLLRRAGGNEERMLTFFFDQIGWPSSLPTSEKDAFLRKLMQRKQSALENLVKSESLPLRPGIESFVDEAIEAGVPLIFLTASSRLGEHIASLLVQKLGPTRIEFVKVLGKKEVESSMYGQLMLGAGVSGQEEELAKELTQAVIAEKQRIAEEVASILRLSVEIDTSFAEVSKEAIMLLRAGAEASKAAFHRCILLAGGDTGVQAASRIGMPCIVVRSSVTARAEFPAARGALDGFGAGAITLARLCRYM